VAAPRVSAPRASLDFCSSGCWGALFYGIIGWVFTAIACLTYNLVARWTGGIEVQVVQAPPPEPVPAWGPPRSDQTVGPGQPQG
jgi:hypothetical protein